MTACVRGNANRCQIDYSIAGTDSDSPDTFEVGATTANSETEDCTTSALHINQCQVGTTEATVAAVGFNMSIINLQLQTTQSCYISQHTSNSFLDSALTFGQDDP